MTAPSTKTGKDLFLLSGQKIAWILFLATCLHLAFLVPSGTLFPGERTKLFSGLLCAFSLLFALRYGNRRAFNRKSPEIWISLCLSFLAFISAFLSSTPLSSSSRAFVIMSSGLGGFWGAKLLLQSRERMLFFQWFCVLVLTLLIIFTLLGKALSGNIYHFLDTNWHPVGSRILLLSFAPFALCFGDSSWKRLLGFILLTLSYAVFVLSGNLAGAGANVIIPALLCVLAFCLKKWRTRQLVCFIALLLIMSAAIANHYRILDGKINRYHPSIAYRIENIFYSWHIVKQRPLLGNGLWAPRETYLEDYSIHYPHVTKDMFRIWTRDLRTSENIFLTFMADLGFPFVIIYSVSLIILLKKLLLLHFWHPPDLAIHPTALLFPLAGELIHLLVYDGLFHPQANWYFHILLGLIPSSINVSKNLSYRNM